MAAAKGAAERLRGSGVEEVSREVEAKEGGAEGEAGGQGRDPCLCQLVSSQPQVLYSFISFRRRRDCEVFMVTLRWIDVGHLCTQVLVVCERRCRGID